eukprot:2513814-Rhodomonas_salina.1
MCRMEPRSVDDAIADLFPELLHSGASHSWGFPSDTPTSCKTFPPTNALAFEYPQDTLQEQKFCRDLQRNSAAPEVSRAAASYDQRQAAWVVQPAYCDVANEGPISACSGAVQVSHPTFDEMVYNHQAKASPEASTQKDSGVFGYNDFQLAAVPSPYVGYPVYETEGSQSPPAHHFQNQAADANSSARSAHVPKKKR